MLQSDLLIAIVKLVLGGVVAFLAIMLWNKTRDSAWISLIAGAVTGYAGLVFELLSKLGFFSASGITVAGLPFATLFFAIIPYLFYIVAFVLLLLRSR
jgi:hypothetical protein